MEKSIEDAYFVQACVWLQWENYNKAYDILKQLAISIEVPRRDSYRLCAAVAAKVDPPKWLEVIDSLSPILKWNKHDFDIVSSKSIARLYIILVVINQSIIIILAIRSSQCILLFARVGVC